MCKTTMITNIVRSRHLGMPTGRLSGTRILTCSYSDTYKSSKLGRQYPIACTSSRVYTTMPALSEPVPIVLIGRTTEIGRPVAQGLLPEYEVIRFIQSFEAAKAELPYLLAGSKPPESTESATNDVGTHNYGRPARAVLFGRAFSQEQAEALKESTRGSAKDPVAWIVGDQKKKPAGDGPPPGYANIAIKTLRGVLDQWRDEGAVKDDIILY
ncbi:hypothetical protein F4810DRAFT_664210 [Camillea tinctor]|nr:hypothetical protein F4810DRAFT_664210 [Camillea tinctor]